MAVVVVVQWHSLQLKLNLRSNCCAVKFPETQTPMSDTPFFLSGNIPVDSSVFAVFNLISNLGCAEGCSAVTGHVAADADDSCGGQLKVEQSSGR